MRNDDVVTCLKMLKARGGALDLKAVEIIEQLQINADMLQAQGDATLEVLENERKRLEENALLTKQIDKMNVSYETSDVRAVLADALEPVLGKGTPWGVMDLAHILISEYRGAVRELHEVVDKLALVVPHDSDLTPLLAADAAAEEIKRLRAKSSEHATLTIGNGYVTIELPKWVLNEGDLHSVYFSGSTPHFITVKTIATAVVPDPVPAINTGSTVAIAAQPNDYLIWNGSEWGWQHPEDLTTTEMKRDMAKAVKHEDDWREKLTANITAAVKQVMSEEDAIRDAMANAKDSETIRIINASTKATPRQTLHAYYGGFDDEGTRD